MSFIRLQENVPEVYINASRDFHLLCRLYDCMINSVKFSIDGVLRVINTRLCSNALLSLLQTKLGFFTEKDFSYDEIRYVLRAFPDIIKYKGSKRGILQAVYVFCKLKHIQTIPNIEIINKQNDKPIYQINIILYATPQDTTLLSEIFRYILPTGYTVRYSWRTKEATRVYETYSFNDIVNAYVIDNLNTLENKPSNSIIRSKADIYSTISNADNLDSAKERTINAFDTIQIVNKQEESEDVK